MSRQIWPSHCHKGWERNTGTVFWQSDNYLVHIFAGRDLCEIWFRRQCQEGHPGSEWSMVWRQGSVSGFHIRCNYAGPSVVSSCPPNWSGSDPLLNSFDFFTQRHKRQFELFDDSALSSLFLTLSQNPVLCRSNSFATVGWSELQGMFYCWCLLDVCHFFFSQITSLCVRLPMNAPRFPDRWTSV